MTPIPERLALLPTLVLGDGSHSPGEGQCAMEAAAWLAGEEHSDHPACVSPVIAEFVRRWNDDLPDDATRTRLLAPLIPLTLGTRDGNDTRRAWMALDWLVREHTPAWLELVPSLAHHGATLRALPEILSDATLAAADGALRDARRDAAAAGDAAWTTASAAAWAAARAAARAAAGDAARAAAWAAARDAALDAARAAARAAAGDAAGDAARAALSPTTERLQASAAALVRRMCGVRDA